MNPGRISGGDQQEIPLEYLLSFIREDAPFGDITSSLVLPDTAGEAVIVARQEGIISGLSEAKRLFTYYNVDTGMPVDDGSPVKKGDVLMTLSGPARGILLVERTALNIIGRMSGISTKTRYFVDLVVSQGAQCRIASTRKTAPGLRAIDKKAVILGGGEPHRFSLSDGILIKDNHLAMVSLTDAILAARSGSVYRKIEAEVETSNDAVLAAESGADIILLDNMTPSEVKNTISALESRDLRKGRLIEISGSVNEENIAGYALPGVDIISIGALTHSVRNFDVSLEMKKKQG